MNLKLVKIASVREHLDAHYRGEITYSKAVDLINEDANKQLRLGVVSQQRELLLDFLSKVNGNLIAHPHLQMNSDFVDDYLKSNNCG